FQNSISSLSLPNSITSLGNAAFNYNRLPDDQAFIYERRPDGTENKSVLVSYGGLKKSDIIIPSNIEIIGPSAMFYSAIQSVYIPITVLEIGDFAFAQNALTSLTFTSEKETNMLIGKKAFISNPGLTSVRLPNCARYTSSGADRSFDASV